MAPRQYRLGKRSAQTAETRQRIVEAAMVAYLDLGIPGTSMLEVARRADVAPATVTNHFRTPGKLVEAVFDHIRGTLDVPTAEIFDGATSLDERIGRLVLAMFEFYDRSNRWFQLYLHEVERTPEVRQAEARFWTDIQTLYAEGLGDVLTDQTLAKAIFGLTGPGTLGSMSDAGLSVPEAANLVSRLVLHLIYESSAGRQGQ